MAKTNALSRSLHDVGLATWFGGTFATPQRRRTAGSSGRVGQLSAVRVQQRPAVGPTGHLRDHRLGGLVGVAASRRESLQLMEAAQHCGTLGVHARRHALLLGLGEHRRRTIGQRPRRLGRVPSTCAATGSGSTTAHISTVPQAALRWRQQGQVRTQSLPTRGRPTGH